MSASHLKIAPAPPDLQVAALRLVLGDAGPESAREQAEALVSAGREGHISLAGLVVAVRDNTLVGAAWGLVQPGRTALIWPPRLVAGEPDTTASELLAAVVCRLAGADTCLAQAALSSATSLDAKRFMAHGFHHAADLLYLACGRDCFPNVRPGLPFEIVTFSDDDSERLARLVERTYQGTQDCPELNGVRDTADVIEGYRHTGVFAPERWFIARDGNVDVGCLLLADHPAEEQWELVYMGVAPEARGRGLGAALTRHAQWLAGQAGRARLVLAADARNEPAISIYRAARFSPFDERRIFLRVFETL